MFFCLPRRRFSLDSLETVSPEERSRPSPFPSQTYTSLSVILDMVNTGLHEPWRRRGKRLLGRSPHGSNATRKEDIPSSIPSREQRNWHMRPTLGHPRTREALQPTTQSELPYRASNESNRGNATCSPHSLVSWLPHVLGRQLIGGGISKLWLCMHGVHGQHELLGNA